MNSHHRKSNVSKKSLAPSYGTPDVSSVSSVLVGLDATALSGVSIIVESTPLAYRHTTSIGRCPEGLCCGFWVNRERERESFVDVALDEISTVPSNGTPDVSNPPCLHHQHLAPSQQVP